MSNDSESYDVLPLSVHLFDRIEKGLEDMQPLRPFVAVYFPKDLLDKMNWNRKTPLEITIDGEFLMIGKKEKLHYELEPEDEPHQI